MKDIKQGQIVTGMMILAIMAYVMINIMGTMLDGRSTEKTDEVSYAQTEKDTVRSDVNVIYKDDEEQEIGYEENYQKNKEKP